jgi:hypothetical protein
MILNKTTRASDRYRIIPGHMGNYGDPATSPNHSYQIAFGVDRGNGYQGYMSVTYFLECDHVPQEAKSRCKSFLRSLGYTV